MKQVKFTGYGHYVAAQKKTVSKRGVGPYFCDLEMIRIAEWCRRNDLQVRRGICHGARNGLECDELMLHLPLSEIVGTDLFPYSGKSKETKLRAEVIEWDFNKINNEWIDKFDLVYTNSLDHAYEPKKTLRIWMDQLVWNGVLFVQWNRSDLEAKGGDCFSADPLEMIDLLNEVGTLVDLLYVRMKWQKGNNLRHHGLEGIVYVVRKNRGKGDGD
jgi:hypothetical protein